MNIYSTRKPLPIGLSSVAYFRTSLFHNSVDDYLEWCAELGEEPDKPFSGNLPFRTTKERHRQIYLAAKKANKSINSWMDDVLAKALN